MNPYATPAARVKDVAGTKKGSAFKAVGLGALADTGATVVASQVVGIVFAVSLGDPDITEEKLTAAMMTGFPFSGFWLWSITLGTLASVWGGYVCARIARQNEYRLGAILTVVMIAVACALGTWKYPLLFNLVMAALTYGAIMFGVRLGLAKNWADERENAS